MPSEAIQYLDLDKVRHSPQVREHFDDREITALALSIRAVGQLMPIRVRRDGESFPVVDGARRTLAMRKLGSPTIAAIVEDKDLCSAEVLHRSLIANCQRQDLTPLEKARGIAALIEQTGWNATEAATQLGMSNAGVSRALSLLNLPAEVIQQVESGKLPASTASEIARLADPEQQRALAEEAMRGAMSRDAVSGRRKAQAEKRSKGAASDVSRATAQLGQGRAIAVSGESLDLEKLILWTEELLAIARKARAKGWALGTLMRSLKDQAKTHQPLGT